MTTQVTTIGTVGTMGAARRPSLEELVDRLIAAMFPQEEETTQTVARSVHDARRLRQTGDLDGVLALYSQGKGRAAALSPKDDGTLEVLAALGMRWQPGKILSRRSLRGLRTIGGESWGSSWRIGCEARSRG